MKKFALLTCLFLTCVAAPFFAQKPTAPQLEWHDTEFYLFFHFGPNTFTNLEWGHGTESEDLFNPTSLDCDQWCRVAKAAGARGVVITAKHHDGFCLWPSQYSTHTVRESPWKNGKGDVLRELSDACRRHGLKFGVYLSPWDRNHPKYGTPEYNDIYINTLKELMTGYGDLFEIWWDGANGEGTNGRKQVYDFKRFEKAAVQYQPNAVIFSDIGPGCRWAGNEQGTVSETNWCTLDTAGFGRGATGPPTTVLQTGNENGAVWIPAECDVSIRPGWFYHAEEDDKVKTPEQLFDIYLQSVGHGGNLILNVPPDRRGRIHARDSASLSAFGDMLRRNFANNLALGARVKYEAPGRHYTNTRELTDGKRRNAFRPPAPAEQYTYVVSFKKAMTFNSVLLREQISEGQRVRAFRIEADVNGTWTEIGKSTTIGPRKIVAFDMVTTKRLRVVVTDTKAVPLLSEIEVYMWN